MKINKDLIKLIGKYSKHKKNFIPGKTTLPLMSPSYGNDEIIECLDSLLSTYVTMGKKVKKFEKDFAKYIGTKYAVMVNSGSSANLLALYILTQNRKNKLRNEIITPAVTWATTVFPIINVNCKPVFVDVDLGTYTINTDQLETAISENTLGVMPVHLLGNVCDINKIEKNVKKSNLFLLEDTCEAHGAEFKGKKAGSFGDISTFSFFMSHHITTIEGGMILTSNKKFYELAKSLRAFGWIRELDKNNIIAKKFPTIDKRFLFINMGFNLRPTEIQGSFGIHQLKKLNRFIKIRVANAQYWNKKFKGLDDLFILPKTIKDVKHSYFCYPLTITKNAPFQRKDIVKFLEKKKIETRPIMAGNMTEQPVMRSFNYKIVGKLENSKLIMKNGFFFGNHQDIGENEREFVAESVIEFVNKFSKK